MESDKKKEDQPLRGRAIVLTRPRAQSRDMTSLLESLGAKVIHLPTIQIVEPADWSALDRSIGNLESYNWIIFTSSNGVDFFFRRMAERDGSFPRPGPALCAIGPATEKALERAGRGADLTARDSKAEGVLSAIIERSGGERNIRGLRFLMPRARVARDLLPDELTRLGAQVDVVEAYQTVRPDVSGEEIVKLFQEQKPDAIVFTSSSTVANLATLVGADDLSFLLQGMIVACIGPITAGTAAEHGLVDVIQPESYNAEALVFALVAALGSRGPGVQ